VTGGFGYLKANTRYATDDTFDQDLVLERVANPLSIYGDPNSTAADSSDWMSAFEVDEIPTKAFKARWKDAEPTDFSADPLRVDRAREDEDRVTIAARWVREHAFRKIVAVTMPDPMADPQQVAMAMKLGVTERLIVDLDIYEENIDLFQAVGMTVSGQPRAVPTFKVTQRILSGADVLEEIDWPGKYIPIIPVYGEEVNVNGVRHFRGLVRDAKDIQRNFNFWRTMATEMVALAPKAPFIGKKGAFETDGEKWATVNTQSWAYLEYDGAEAPERQPFQGVPAGALQEAMNASDDMRRILGLTNAPVAADNESSGRAILARQKEGDIATFHFIDNLSRAIRHTGRVLLDMIPHVYSTARVLRIVKPDGTQAAVQVAPAQPPEPQEAPQQPPGNPISVGAAPPQPPQQMGGALNPQIASQLIDLTRVYDLTSGKYDLTVQAGPAYSTLREELNTVLLELVRAYPPAAPAMMDLIVKTLDIPDAQEVANRIQAMAQGQGQNPEAQKQAQQMQGALQQAHNQLQQLQAKLQDAQADADQAKLAAQQAQADNQVKMAELAVRRQELQLKTYEAQTDRLQAETDAERARRETLAAGVMTPPLAA
jgi:hypothetical protein